MLPLVLKSIALFYKNSSLSIEPLIKIVTDQNTRITLKLKYLDYSIMALYGYNPELRIDIDAVDTITTEEAPAARQRIVRLQELRARL